MSSIPWGQPLARNHTLPYTLQCSLKKKSCLFYAIPPFGQGWEFALSLFRSLLFRSSLFCSKSLILKSKCEQFSLLALNKRMTMSKLLSLLFNMSDHEQMDLYKRATVSELLSLLFKKELNEWFARDLSKSLSKKSDSYSFFWRFWTVFYCFTNFYAQERIAPVALCSVALF